MISVASQARQGPDSYAARSGTAKHTSLPPALKPSAATSGPSRGRRPPRANRPSRRPSTSVVIDAGSWPVSVGRPAARREGAEHGRRLRKKKITHTHTHTYTHSWDMRYHHENAGALAKGGHSWSLGITESGRASLVLSRGGSFGFAPPGSLITFRAFVYRGTCPVFSITEK